MSVALLERQDPVRECWLASAPPVLKMALSAKISHPVTTTTHNQPTPDYAIMSLENLLPLGEDISQELRVGR